jgi:hypothetical protein
MPFFNEMIPGDKGQRLRSNPRLDKEVLHPALHLALYYVYNSYRLIRQKVIQNCQVGSSLTYLKRNLKACLSIESFCLPTRQKRLKRSLPKYNLFVSPYLNRNLKKLLLGVYLSTHYT